MNMCTFVLRMNNCPDNFDALYNTYAKFELFRKHRLWEYYARRFLIKIEKSKNKIKSDAELFWNRLISTEKLYESFGGNLVDGLPPAPSCLRWSLLGVVDAEDLLLARESFKKSIDEELKLTRYFLIFLSQFFFIYTQPQPFWGGPWFECITCDAYNLLSVLSLSISS